MFYHSWRPQFTGFRGPLVKCLVADYRLHKRLCPSVGRFVGPSINELKSVITRIVDAARVWRKVGDGSFIADLGGFRGSRWPG